LPFSFLQLFGFHLITNGYKLEISDQGLALTYFARTLAVRWADTKSIHAGWNSALDAIPFGFNKKLFVNYQKKTLDQSLTIWPMFFGISLRELVNLIRPYCSEYPKLIETMSADVENPITL
jgi:hypothetical protein